MCSIEQIQQTIVHSHELSTHLNHRFNQQSRVQIVHCKERNRHQLNAEQGSNIFTGNFHRSIKRMRESVSDKHNSWILIFREICPSVSTHLNHTQIEERFDDKRYLQGKKQIHSIAGLQVQRQSNFAGIFTARIHSTSERSNTIHAY